MLGIADKLLQKQTKLEIFKGRAKENTIFFCFFALLQLTTRLQMAILVPLQNKKGYTL